MNTQLSKICIGTAQFGSAYGLTNKTGHLSVDEISSILELAAEYKIFYLDTAPTYGDAEIKLGKAGLENWKIITKVKTGNQITNSDSFTQSVLESLSRLNISNLYGVLIHNPRLFYDPNIDNLLNELSSLKAKGIINKVGVSVYDSDEVDHILANFDIDIVQIPFNIIDGRLLVSDTLSKLKKRNIEIHARSIYLQGLLLMPIDEQIRQFKRWESLWHTLNDFCNDYNITPLQACLRYVLGNTEIDQVIIGIDNYNQLKQTIDSAIGEIYDVPAELISTDDALCNPLNWEMYAHLRFS